MSVNIRELAILNSTAQRLEELIEACRRRGGLCGVDPELNRDVLRKATALKTALGKLQAAVDDPDHQPARREQPARKEPLHLRLYFRPALAELARFVSYGGKRESDVWARWQELRARFGDNKVKGAVEELTVRDVKSGLTVLRPEVRRLCGQLLGPAPEDPGYEDYWRQSGRTPPADHQPPPPGEESPASPRRGRGRGA
jgi:hypothetical protein